MHPQEQFYRDAVRTLDSAGVPFLLGGAAALKVYTGIDRDTKDLDLFVRQRDIERALSALQARGYPSEVFYPHWLAKAHHGRSFVDLIFNSANGACTVDDAWFEHAPRAHFLGTQVSVCPVEEMVWVKSFIMDRERFDGADVAHLLLAMADRIDWQRLLHRFGPSWRVLFSQLVLFEYIFPGHREKLPSWLLHELAGRLKGPGPSQVPTNLCQGTLLSRDQYLPDVQERGFEDGRLPPHGNLTPDEVRLWTAGDEARKAS